MKIDELWNSFEKTGSIIKYLEYKNYCREKQQSVNVDRRNSDEIDKHR